MKRKWIVIVIPIVIIYLSFEVWIANSAHQTIVRAMEDTTSSSLMSEQVFNKLNPTASKKLPSSFVYDSNLHKIGIPWPIHLFLWGKIRIKHSYQAEISNKPYGFSETVVLSMRLRGFHWYAARAYVSP